MNTRGVFSRLRVGWNRNKVANEGVGSVSHSGRVASPKSSTEKTFFSRIVQWLKRILGFQKEAPKSNLVSNVITDIEGVRSRTNTRRSTVTKPEDSQPSRRNQVSSSWEEIENPTAPRHPLNEWQLSKTAIDKTHIPPENTEVSTTPSKTRAPLPVDGADKRHFIIHNKKPHMKEFLVCNKSPAYDLTQERDFFNVKLEHEYLKVASEVAKETMGAGRGSNVIEQGTTANQVFYKITNDEKYMNEYYQHASWGMNRAIAMHNDYCNIDADSELAKELADTATIPWDQHKQEEMVIGELKIKFKDQYKHFLKEKLTKEETGSFLKKIRS